jgi:hypothetical protein
VIENPYAQEAKERWADIDAYQESARRLKNYTPEDIELAKKAMGEATMDILDAMRAGLPADSKEAMAGAEAHRASITEWWYECSYDMHTNLATMYVADERFAKTYNDMEPGLAQYVHDAIYANAVANS